MDKGKASKLSKVAAFNLLDKALSEYRSQGAVMTARCDSCGGLLEVEARGENSFSVSCPCGKYRDTLRGL